MSKTMTVEEFEHARGRDIIDDAKAFGEVVVRDEHGAEVIVVRFGEHAHRPVGEVAAELREEGDQRVAAMNTPEARERMRDIFQSTPEQLAEAANAAEAERRR